LLSKTLNSFSWRSVTKRPFLSVTVKRRGTRLTSTTILSSDPLGAGRLGAWAGSVARHSASRGTALMNPAAREIIAEPDAGVRRADASSDFRVPAAGAPGS